MDKMSESNRTYFEMSMKAFLGENVDDELLYSVSPARLIDDQVPPTFLWATSNDETVPVCQSLLMAEALSEAGIPFELHIYENGPHGLSLATQATAVAEEFLNPRVSDWTRQVCSWLEKRFPFRNATSVS